MKHIKIFDNNSKDMLTAMQDLNLSPKALGYWISMVTSSEGDINAIGIAIVAPDLPTVAQCLFEEFNLEDFFEDFEDKDWKDLPTIMEKVEEMSGSYDNITVYNWWEMDPKSTNSQEAKIETESLLNPVRVSELGNEFFKNFDAELLRTPFGL